MQDGTVTLRGSVPNAPLLRAAVEAAEHSTRVVAVRNELTFPRPVRAKADVIGL